MFSYYLNLYIYPQLLFKFKILPVPEFDPPEILNPMDGKKKLFLSAVDVCAGNKKFFHDDKLLQKNARNKKVYNFSKKKK